MTIDPKLVDTVLAEEPEVGDHITNAYPTAEDVERDRQAALGRKALRIIASMVWPDGKVRVTMWSRAQILKLAQELRHGK